MSLFQRMPQASNPINYVTVGLNKTLLIAGLGNPGPEYDQTRHNIGFAAIDAFVKCVISTGKMGDTRVICIKPSTFMNLSGEAVQAVSNFYKVQPDKLVVVHDELDINFGQIRLRMGGSAAGHNGIKSVTQHMGESYARVRIGIGPKVPEQMDSADFVLKRFSQEELGHMDELTRETNAILSELVFGAELLPETRNFLI
jgi:PTH1 family peptidyl-tRNA hydrolase